MYQVQSSDLDKKEKLKGQKQVDSKKAIPAAEKDLGFKPTYEKSPSSELYVYQNGSDTTYAYVVNLNFLSPEPGNYYYFVDAISGKVLIVQYHLFRSWSKSRCEASGKAGSETCNRNKCYWLR